MDEILEMVGFDSVDTVPKYISQELRVPSQIKKSRVIKLEDKIITLKTQTTISFYLHAVKIISSDISILDQNINELVIQTKNIIDIKKSEPMI